ncbi:lipase family protein [Vibrio aestuarianus]|uniref:lipase family protein n=1 Tax=Vibrio aestuarianus TaxID=28171 RepID=UPI00237CC222|nr:hypothetical protein [Vibrio aestuarianus]MDE1263530.1 hypothetical protein [Vibrio aestuarianus]MDE1295470.1 hypothetical protein [Vibrio aestuarianus]MDE1336080.1 hypothetical protein [Vibrio aestuarianus]
MFSISDASKTRRYNVHSDVEDKRAPRPLFVHSVMNSPQSSSKKPWDRSAQMRAPRRERPETWLDAFMKAPNPVEHPQPQHDKKTAAAASKPNWRHTFLKPPETPSLVECLRDKKTAGAASQSSLVAVPLVAVPLAGLAGSPRLQGESLMDLMDLMEKVPAPQDRNHKKDILRSAALANYPYQQDLAVLCRATDKLWELDLLDNDSDFKKVVEDLDLKISPLTGMFSDSKSGLVGFIFLNHTSKELRVVFGGTTSGEKTGELKERTIGNLTTTARQWQANAKNAILGEKPDSYQQAKCLATEIVTVMEGEKYKDYSLSFSGHSKGGGEAAYAAAMVSTPENPVKAECFSSAQFGRSILTEVNSKLAPYGLEQAKKAVSGINHYKIKGDVVPNIHKVRPTLSHIGKVMTLPRFDIRGANNIVGCHVRFYDHIERGALL